jgi:membrane-associated phospholipid phosphatase
VKIISVIYFLRGFYLTLLGFWIIAGALLARLGYIDSFLWLNSFYAEWSDIVLPPMTHLADSAILVALLTVFFIRRNPALLVVAFASLTIAGGITLGLKKFIFYDWPRPLEALGSAENFHSLLPLRFQSFPSGHATTIMSALPAIAFFFRYRPIGVQIGVALLGILIMYTRVYIGVHFLGDILAGSVIGITIATLTLAFGYEPVQRKMLALDLESKQTVRSAIIYFGYALLVVGLLRVNGLLGVEAY